MSKIAFRRLVAAAALVTCCGFSAALAEPGGTYVIDGGGYSIDVKMDGGNLTVVEPNKTSVYVKQGDGSYQFTNPTNDITYGLRFVDDSTLEAFKPGSNGEPTILKRFGSPESSATTADVADSEKYEALAGHYLELAQSNPDNVQAYTACGGVALKRSQSSKAEADAYAEQMAQMLRQILTDPNSNPCPDVFLSW